MKSKFLTVVCLLLLCCIQANAQSSKDLFRKANNLRNAQKYSEAKELYQKIIDSGDKSYLKDCELWIKWIDAVNPDKDFETSVFDISDDNITIPYQGGQWIVTVSGKGSWSASVNSEWCTVKKQGRNIIISSTENEDLRNRVAQIQVVSGGRFKTIEVTNEGMPEYLRSSVSSISFPAGGDTNDVDIYSNTNWKIQNIPTWVTAVKKNGKITFTAQENKKSVEREANVKIINPSDSVIIINIYQGAGREHLSFSKNQLNFGPEGGDEYIKVYTDAESWMFGDFPHWCQISKIGQDSIKVHCTQNEPINEMREASVNVTTGNQTLGISVVQEARPIIPVIPELGIGGRTVSFGINAGYLYPTIMTSVGGDFKGSVINYALGNSDETSSYTSTGGFSINAFADIRLYKNFYLMAGLNYLRYSYKNVFEADVVRIIPQTNKYYLKGITQNKYTENYTMNLLDIPVLFSYRLPVNKKSHVQFNIGPVLSVGLSSNMQISGSTDSETLKAYKITNHQLTNDRYDSYNYSMHYSGNGKVDLYDKNYSYYERHEMGSNTDLNKNGVLLDSPYNRINLGARIGIAYELSGVSFGIEYNFMITNMARKKFWDSDRCTIFDQVPDNVMSGYNQRNGYLLINIGYTFRY